MNDQICLFQMILFIFYFSRFLKTNIEMYNLMCIGKVVLLLFVIIFVKMYIIKSEQM